MFNQTHHHTPMHQRSSRSHHHEPRNTSVFGMPQGLVSGAGASVVHGDEQHSRTLCIAIDDYGLSTGICEASLQLVHMGRANAIGCMVGAPKWSEWAPALQQINSLKTDVGLHLDFTEHPCASGSRSLGHLIAACWTGGLSVGGARSEICRQLDAFEMHVGRRPAYVDGHQHVHQFPVIRDALIAELKLRYSDALPWLRNTSMRRKSGSLTSAIGHWTANFKPCVIAALGANSLAQQARGQGFVLNASLLGAYDFHDDTARYLARLRRWLNTCRSGDVLMCHPSSRADIGDPIAAARCTEYQVLLSDVFGSWLSDGTICLKRLTG